MDPLVEINQKLDALMAHMGCKSMPKEEYLGMSDEDKDAKDEADMMPKIKDMK